MIDPQRHIGRLEDLVRAQMAEINKLRAENQHLVEWINGDSDALACLQRVYTDPNASESNRIKAAAAAISFERPKLAVQVQVGPAVLGERLDQARTMKTVNPPLIEHQPT
jgi:hypothetical protein